MSSPSQGHSSRDPSNTEARGGNFKGPSGSRKPATLQQARGWLLQRAPSSLEWEEELAPLRNVLACVARHTVPMALPRGHGDPRGHCASCTCCPGLPSVQPGAALLLVTSRLRAVRAQVLGGLPCGADTDQGREAGPPCRGQRLLA